MIPPAASDTAGAPRYRIERADEGYRVVGEGLLIWEPTLGEAAERRDELESSGWRYPLQPRPEHASSEDSPAMVYGPVTSRRLGRSLGVNFTPPGCRVCSFDCVYCECGRGRREGPGVRWPAPGALEAALSHALAHAGPLDSITISGHGEPTLHPRFGAAAAAVLAESHRARPGVPVRILTNGSRAGRAEVRRALDLLDERIVKVDAGWERVNRPSTDCDPEALLPSLARLRNVTVQSCFVEGAVRNVDEHTVRRWAEFLAKLRPGAVQIYTIDRQPAESDVRPTHPAQLEEIACMLRDRTGINARVYGPYAQPESA